MEDVNPELFISESTSWGDLVHALRHEGSLLPHKHLEMAPLSTRKGKWPGEGKCPTSGGWVCLRASGNPLKLLVRMGLCVCGVCVTCVCLAYVCVVYVSVWYVWVLYVFLRRVFTDFLNYPK